MEWSAGIPDYPGGWKCYNHHRCQGHAHGIGSRRWTCDSCDKDLCPNCHRRDSLREREVEPYTTRANEDNDNQDSEDIEESDDEISNFNGYGKSDSYGHGRYEDGKSKAKGYYKHGSRAYGSGNDHSYGKSSGKWKKGSQGHDSYTGCAGKKGKSKSKGYGSGKGKLGGHSYDSYTSRAEKSGDRDDPYGGRTGGGSSGWKPSLRR